MIANVLSDMDGEDRHKNSFYKNHLAYKTICVLRLEVLVYFHNNFSVELEKINIFRGVNNYKAFLLQICLTIFSESWKISTKLLKTDETYNRSARVQV